MFKLTKIGPQKQEEIGTLSKSCILKQKVTSADNFQLVSPLTPSKYSTWCLEPTQHQPGNINQHAYAHYNKYPNQSIRNSVLQLW